MQTVIYADTPEEVIQEFIAYFSRRAEFYAGRGRTKLEKAEYTAVARFCKEEADWWSRAVLLPNSKSPFQPKRKD
jgi:hypothetical protein